MSALLPLEATQLNILAEYGYSFRRFSKYPYVCSGINSTSALFLVHQHCGKSPIANRIKNYRNHFVLYTSKDCVVIARTETTLILNDNDAIINYDIVKPLTKVTDRYRAKCSTWDISFDRIAYSADKPSSLANFEMICSGEWWYFDKGVILNGLTRYEKYKPIKSIFIYYEFHTKCNVRMPSDQAIIPMNAYIGPISNDQTQQQQSTKPQNISQQSQEINNKRPQEMVNNERPNERPNNERPQEIQQQQQQLLQSQTDEIPSTSQQFQQQNQIEEPMDVDGGGGDVNLLPTESFQEFSMRQQEQQTSDDALTIQRKIANKMANKDTLINNVLNLSGNNSTMSSFLLPATANSILTPNTLQRLQNAQVPLLINHTQQQQFQISTLPSSILPMVNSNIMPRRTTNDLTELPKIPYEAIIPSLFWFKKRSNELEQGNISEFLPINYNMNKVY